MPDLDDEPATEPLAVEETVEPIEPTLVEPELPEQEAAPLAAPEPEPVPVLESVPEPVPEQPTRVEQEVEAPEQSPGVRRSKRVKFQTRAPYVPSFTGSKYAVAVTQLENHGMLHPDAHLSFLNHMIKDAPDVVVAIMMQLSLKAGLKEWGKTAWDAAYAEMKQLQGRPKWIIIHPSVGPADALEHCSPLSGSRAKAIVPRPSRSKKKLKPNSTSK